MKTVFISSIQRDFGDVREAARKAVESLGCMRSWPRRSAPARRAHGAPCYGPRARSCRPRGSSRQVAELKERWLEAAGRPRAGSAPRRLIEAIPTHPVLTLVTAQSITGLSDEACRRALNRLEQSSVLPETTAGKRNRVWESVGLFDLLDRLEREVGDVRRAAARTN